VLDYLPGQHAIRATRFAIPFHYIEPASWNDTLIEVMNAYPLRIIEASHANQRKRVAGFHRGVAS
jgi:hypothetical protein